MMNTGLSEIWSIRGPVASAKSTLATTFPGQCFWFDLEYGAHRALDRYGMVNDDRGRHKAWNYLEENDDAVTAATLNALIFKRGEIVEGKREAWTGNSQKYVEVLQDPYWNNIIVDTWKELWYLAHRSYLQELQEDDMKVGKTPRKNIIDIEYAIPNSRMDNWMAVAKAFKKSLILISHERPVRVATVSPSGSITTAEHPTQTELDGYRHTLKKADWGIVTGLEKDCQIAHSCPGWHFTATIEKSPVGQQLVGQVIRDPSYDRIMNLAKMLGVNGNG